MSQKYEVLFNNTTGCKKVCKKKQITCEEVREIVYSNYIKSGILVRGNDGWIKGTNNNYLRNLPVIGIFNVALPDLPLQGTSSGGLSGIGIGTQWKTYLDSSSSFRNSLTKSDFICL